MTGEPRDIWILDLRTQDISRLTTDEQSDAPVWLDSDRILYRAAPLPVGVFSRPVDGGEPRLVRRSTTAPTAYPLGLTPNRRTLLVLFASTIGTPAPLDLRGPYFYGANRTWDEALDGRFLITRMGAAGLPQGSLEVQVVVGFSRVLEGRAP